MSIDSEPPGESADPQAELGDPSQVSLSVHQHAALKMLADAGPVNLRRVAPITRRWLRRYGLISNGLRHTISITEFGRMILEHARVRMMRDQVPRSLL